VKRILIVEDIEDSRELLVQLLEDEYALFEAPDAPTALEVVRREGPDLIITDISLPGGDGYSFMRSLRDEPAFGDRPIVVVTAHAMVGDRERALRSGANEYLSKPVDADVLFETLGRLL